MRRYEERGRVKCEVWTNEARRKSAAVPCPAGQTHTHTDVPKLTSREDWRMTNDTDKTPEFYRA